MLRAVVDDADDPGAGGHRRIPVSVDDALQVFGGDAGDEVQRQVVDRVVLRLQPRRVQRQPRCIAVVLIPLP
jgi:hypothetical protein